MSFWLGFGAGIATVIAIVALVLHALTVAIVDGITDEIEARH